MKHVRKSSRIPLLVLVLILTINLFSGCGDDTQTSAASSAESTISAETQPEATVAPEPETSEQPGSVLEDSALEDSIVEAPQLPPITLPMTEEPVYFDIFTNAPENINQGVVQDMNDVLALKNFCEASNVYLNFDCASFLAATERYNLIVASEDLPDIISTNVTYNGGNLKAVEDGIYLPLTDLIKEYMPYYASFLAEDDIYSDVVENDGSVVSIYRLYNEPKDASFGHVVRQDWLDELGLDVPLTYDDYTETMRAFHSAYGCTNPYLLSGSAMSSGGPNLVSGYGNIGFIVNGTPGSHFYLDGETVHSSLLEEGYRDYVEMLHNWYDEGLISRDFINTGDFFLDGNTLGIIGSDQAGIFYAGQDFLNNYAEMSQDPDFAITGIHAPVLDENNITNNHFNDNIQRCVSAYYTNITTSCEDPELACQFIDYWYSPQGMMDYSYGVEGVSYTLNEDGSVALTDAVMNDPDFSPNIALYKYSFYMGLFGVQDSNQQRLFYSDLTTKTVDIWSTDTDDTGLLPTISINDEEYTSTLNDIDTHASENILAFITGTRPMEEWDSFVEQLKSMGLEDCLSRVQEEFILRESAASVNPFKP